MLKKLVDVDELVASLRKAGMEAGVCPEGGSSYPLVRLAGGMEIYGYVPDQNFQGPETEDLVAQRLLDSLAANQAETAPPVLAANQPQRDMTIEEAESFAREAGEPVTARAIRHAARAGYIPGARKLGRDWLIPYKGFDHYLNNRPKPGRK